MAVPTLFAEPASIERVTTDGELVERARGGDTAAFGELVERHRGAVYRAAVAALRDPAEAEDVAQDALVLAFKRIGQFRGEASIRTWMVTIAWRLSLSRRRRPLRRLKEMAGLDGGDVEILASLQPSAERIAIDNEQLRIMRDRIRALPARLRDPLLLTAAGDLTQDEIAAALGMPPGTFRWRLMEARKRLRQP